MKRFTTVAVLLCIAVGMSSCLRQKYRYGLRRNNHVQPTKHKMFVKQHTKEEKTMFFANAK
ncbi:hypothetical protein [Polluticoccus soli]|uniref:hypothetical protein n=1 Tax=Polluticoccus soli TaxID=3034150 RepID=UPI0023E291BE|nr:hypothetical protein [Flavipsychrobacter sp. JY13-12]